MPRWNCSLFERVFKNIDGSDPSYMRWMGTIRKSNMHRGHIRNPLSFWYHDQPIVKEQDHQLNVVRYLVFNYYDDRNQWRDDPTIIRWTHDQDRLKFSYAFKPEDPAIMNIWIAKAPATVMPMQIPTRERRDGKIIVAQLFDKTMSDGEITRSYQSLPQHMPHVVGEDRKRMFQHYLEGGTDQDNPYVDPANCNERVSKDWAAKYGDPMVQYKRSIKANSKRENK